jgi:hypothetical protein
MTTYYDTIPVPDLRRCRFAFALVEQNLKVKFQIQSDNVLLTSETDSDATWNSQHIHSSRSYRIIHRSQEQKHKTDHIHAHSPIYLEKAHTHTLTMTAVRLSKLAVATTVLVFTVRFLFVCFDRYFLRCCLSLWNVHYLFCACCATTNFGLFEETRLAFRFQNFSLPIYIRHSFCLSRYDCAGLNPFPIATRASSLHDAS